MEVPDVIVPMEAGRLGLAMLGSVANRLSGLGYGPGQFCADDVTPQQPGFYSKARPVNVACN